MKFVFEYPYEDYIYLGIETKFVDYRLCFYLNNWLDINLKKIDPHLLTINNSLYYFSKYGFKNKEEETIILLSNKAISIHQSSKQLFNIAPEVFILSEYKAFDFILILEKSMHIQNIVDELNLNKISIFVTCISLESIKNKENLICHYEL